GSICKLSRKIRPVKRNRSGKEATGTAATTARRGENATATLTLTWPYLTPDLSARRYSRPPRSPPKYSASGGSRVQRSAALPSAHSFHGEVFSSGWLLLSIPLVQLWAAHKLKTRAVLASAPFGSAPLRRLTAPPHCLFHPLFL